MVEIKRYRGGLGNRMFQYAVAYCYADLIGAKLICPGHADEMFRLEESFGSYRDWDHTFLTDDNVVDRFKNPVDAYHEVWGFFQKYCLLKKYKCKVRELFRYQKLNCKVHENDIVVHIRRGDYFESGPNVLDLSYYTNILDRIGYNRVVVCGVGIDDRVRQVFEKYNPIYTNWDYRRDFEAIHTSKRIIMSNSTFCWWGAWLSWADQIFFPVPENGHGSYFADDHEHQALRVDEGRYEYVQCRIENA